MLSMERIVQRPGHSIESKAKHHYEDKSCVRWRRRKNTIVLPEAIKITLLLCLSIKESTFRYTCTRSFRNMCIIKQALHGKGQKWKWSEVEIVVSSTFCNRTLWTVKLIFSCLSHVKSLTFSQPLTNWKLFGEQTK